MNSLQPESKGELGDMAGDKKIMSVQVLMDRFDPEKGHLVEKEWIPFDDFVYLSSRNIPYCWSKSKKKAFKEKYPNA